MYFKSRIWQRGIIYVFSMDGASVCMDLPILCFIIHCSDRVQDSVIHSGILAAVIATIIYYIVEKT